MSNFEEILIVHAIALRWESDLSTLSTLKEFREFSNIDCEYILSADTVFMLIRVEHKTVLISADGKKDHS